MKDIQEHFMYFFILWTTQRYTGAGQGSLRAVLLLPWPRRQAESPRCGIWRDILVCPRTVYAFRVNVRRRDLGLGGIWENSAFPLVSV